MTDIADKLRTLRGKLVSLPCFVLSPGGRWMSTTRRCPDDGKPKCLRCEALAEFPNPDTVGEVYKCLLDATARLEMCEHISKDDESSFLSLSTKLRGVGFDVIEGYHAALAKLEEKP